MKPFVFLCIVMWIANIALLSRYIYVKDADPWSIATLVFVVTTGLIPMLRDKEKNDWAISHTVSGILSTAFSGLLLGHAAQCGQDSYEHIDLLIWAAVVNGLSGISAHFGFIDSDKLKALYYEDGPKSWAYNDLDNKPRWVGKSSNYFSSRLNWYIGLFILSGVFLCIHLGTRYENTSSSCIIETKLLDIPILYWSPIIHTVAFAIMTLVTLVDTDDLYLLQIINFPVMHIAAILSMFNVMYGFGQVADWFIVLGVYVYLAMAHISN